ncbi:ABC transporter ATP-binding protein [Pseudocolwellia sp. HL-MZ7]|uniref:ABC transporter ATP-binding protein n=1 Tax=Pseudocolwellia sp. HL-MZ7 TaxID=3400627 RepID=UPI003CE9BD2F
MTHIIEIHQLQVKLQQKTILSDISFALEAGDILGLVGPSGCGKTTLLNTLAGFIEQEDGSISIGDSALITKQNLLPPEQRNIGMIFQDYALFPHLTVEKNVGFGIDKLDKASRSARINELLSLLELKDLGQRYPHQLSGGQQQRVAIARALAPQPQVLLLDEPFSNIDARLRNELMIEIRQLLKSLNMTAIFVTHNKDEVFTFADKIAVMYEGQLLQIGSPIYVSQHPNSWQVADFLQLGSWLPFKKTENLIETALGIIELDSTTQLSNHIQSTNESSDSRSDESTLAESKNKQVMLIKPKDVDVVFDNKPNVVVNHIGITEQGYHYIVNSIENSEELNINRLSFHHEQVFELGQKLSICIKSHHYLTFQRDAV